MSPFQLTRFFIFLGVLFSGYVCYVLVMMNDHALPWWNFSYGIIFSICVFCGAGLWLSKLWSLRLSLLLAMTGLGLGLYFAHFAWTFWIFKQPTFLDRIIAVLNPQILVLVLVPTVWLTYFLRPGTRAYFKA